MCPRSEMTRPIKHMNTDLALKVFKDAGKNNLYKINLFGFGESLLHPSFNELIKEAGKLMPKTKINISTQHTE